MSIKKTVPIVIAIALITGCLTRMPTSSGRPIDEDFVKTIEKGKTTMEEVRAKLGEPKAITRGPETQTWSYMHWQGKPATFGYAYSKSSMQTLTITFKEGKVVDYSLSTATQ